ncbi:Integrase/recombinase xerD [Orchesella cincta]|uniref:Integrase/recombinase xerD n=1 Tax=Orchesella cincta TaxID=48709 RepID=A0A1D2MES3_ORCCI|nr:Integrase/recombinase xerD [Orchesella cincta]
MRTPQPRYTETWDPSILVSFIQKLDDNGKLSLPQLTKKLVCLLALTKACRSSDICALDINGMSFTHDGVIFKRLHLSKTSRKGFLPDSFFPKYDAESSLCVVRVLKEYISRTSEYRLSSKLILGTVKPYNPVSTNTVSRWIIEFMQLAGIDTALFKSHSVRSSATSKASQRGMSLIDIQRAADWSSPNTFLKFYKRYYSHSGFGTTVLSSSN